MHGKLRVINQSDCRDSDTHSIIQTGSRYECKQEPNDIFDTLDDNFFPICSMDNFSYISLLHKRKQVTRGTNGRRKKLLTKLSMF